MRDDLRRELLQRQLGVMWRFAEQFVVDHLDLDAMLWAPSDHVCTVRATDDGWVADWPDEETQPLPDVSIAWLLWHIEWWWSDTLARVTGRPGIPPEAHRWSGSTDGIVAAKNAWDEFLASADLDELVPWHLPEPQPMWFIASWVNVELTKNLAEINQLMGLRANT